MEDVYCVDAVVVMILEMQLKFFIKEEKSMK